MKGFQPHSQRTDDIPPMDEPAERMSSAYPEVGRSWREPTPIRPGAFFNDTEQPDEFEPEPSSSISYYVVVGLIVTCVLVFVANIGLMILRALNV